jgi:hypothetical protein
MKSKVPLLKLNIPIFLGHHVLCISLILLQNIYVQPKTLRRIRLLVNVFVF